MEKFEKKENEDKQSNIIGVQRKIRISEIEEKVEAIIFLAKEIVTVQELAQFYTMEKFEMEEVLYNLREKRKNTGINLKIENGAVYLVSNPLFGFEVKRFFNPEMKLKKLSRSAMETLAIIAYKGPVTKAEIEQIRGAGADKTMANLLERKLIYISGKKKSIGTPNLYEVTQDFYSYLNIHGREELPGSEQFQKINLLYKEDEKTQIESPDNENAEK
ncbi:chromosome segregation and condensation protein ScpB [Leptotrichia shahii]|uniref:Chromosome segregation and condensation protein ScpB n=1 Tax=Leptotrichia shahii TaxID=157691 RepID=A0A510JSR4_9FUSO|nr:SMC-Scp complex subunit ScpB [Leptotrichia shahii]BBM41491.1 chromosome segregation and condensation protein ScpB [Leptotrichia shahii]